MITDMSELVWKIIANFNSNAMDFNSNAMDFDSATETLRNLNWKLKDFKDEPIYVMDVLDNLVLSRIDSTRVDWGAQIRLLSPTGGSKVLKQLVLPTIEKKYIIHNSRGSPIRNITHQEMDGPITISWYNPLSPDFIYPSSEGASYQKKNMLVRAGYEALNYERYSRRKGLLETGFISDMEENKWADMMRFLESIMEKDNVQS